MSRSTQNSDPVAGVKKPRRRWLKISLLLLAIFGAWQLVASLTHAPAPLQVAARVSDGIYQKVYGGEIEKRAAALPKELNILLVGLDSRVASDDNHADAIHLITIRTTDPVGATITSIPRGTVVKGYGMPDDISFMANLRRMRGRKTFMKAIAKLAKKDSIDYYAEVTFSQVMGVLELLGYKDPATALQFLRHRKSFPLGDVQRSHNQGEFIRQQVIRHADMLTGAKGDLLIRMGLGMVDTDLDLETVQALIYRLQSAKALDEAHIGLDLLPHENLSALEDIEIPDPEQMNGVVNKLVRRVGDEIDDLGRYDPYPRVKGVVERAGGASSPKGVIAVLEPVYAQKAWLQVQERPRRQELRDRVEALLVKAYTDLKQPAKATAVRDYMAQERKAFSEVESEHRAFTYGRRLVKHRSVAPDPAALERARLDNAGQEQTPIAPQPVQASGDEGGNHDSLRIVPVAAPKAEPHVIDVDSSGGRRN
jgi:anionic cell wall polymer biosynthesis LytR-Cps2A-Psr (LCP) family protein